MGIMLLMLLIEMADRLYRQGQMLSVLLWDAYQVWNGPGALWSWATLALMIGAQQVGAITLDFLWSPITWLTGARQLGVELCSYTSYLWAVCHNRWRLRPQTPALDLTRPAANAVAENEFEDYRAGDRSSDGDPPAWELSPEEADEQLASWEEQEARANGIVYRLYMSRMWDRFRIQVRALWEWQVGGCAPPPSIPAQPFPLDVQGEMVSMRELCTFCNQIVTIPLYHGVGKCIPAWCSYYGLAFADPCGHAPRHCRFAPPRCTNCDQYGHRESECCAFHSRVRHSSPSASGPFPPLW